MPGHWTLATVRSGSDGNAILAKLILQRDVIEEGHSDLASEVSLDSLRSTGVYVLLGAPGAGKTTYFRQEASATGGVFHTARDIIALGLSDVSADETVFIDGLDEVRAGDPDPRGPLDKLRGRIVSAGVRRFRIACRSADWLTTSDPDALGAIASQESVRVVSLQPLRPGQSIELLDSILGVGNGAEFFAEAADRGLSDLLENPHTLELLARSLSDGRWPKNLRSTYERACESLAQELNDEHRASGIGRGVPAAEILDAAGYLATLCLLTGENRLRPHDTGSDGLSVQALTRRGDLPLELALRTRLFRALGDGSVEFAHRRIAEFLSAAYLCRGLVGGGLAANRIRALIHLDDGRVPFDLRGVNAWLASLCPARRHHFVQADPVGVVLYGDVSGLSLADKRSLIDSLSEEAQRFEGFRSPRDPVGPLAALYDPRLAGDFEQRLAAPTREPHHQALLSCFLDSIEGARVQSEFRDALNRIVRDATYSPGIRRKALTVLLSDASSVDIEAVRMLKEVETGSVNDPDDELLALALEGLYPDHLGVSETIAYARRPKRPNLFGRYHALWYYEFARLTSTKDLDDAARLLHESLVSQEIADRHELPQRGALGQVLLRLLREGGDSSPPESLARWLDYGSDQFGDPLIGTREAEEVGDWLRKRPDRFLEILKTRALQCDDPTELEKEIAYGPRQFYDVTEPDEVASLWLELASNTADDATAGVYLTRSTQIVLSGNYDGELSLERLVEFVESRPPLSESFSDATFCKLHPIWVETAQRRLKGRAQSAQRRHARLHLLRQKIHLIAAADPMQPVHGELAMHYLGYSGDASKAPIERLSDYLGDDEALISAALEGFDDFFKNGLPSLDETIAHAVEKNVSIKALCCLVGAELAFERDPDAFANMVPDRGRQLAAIHAADLTGKPRDWYEWLALAYPEVVGGTIADMFERLIEAKADHIPGIYDLCRRTDQVSTAGLPSVLGVCSARRLPIARLPLATDVLHAALVRLPKVTLGPLVSAALKRPSLPVWQRTVWWATAIVLDPDEYAEQGLDWIAKSTQRLEWALGFLSDEALRALIEDLPPPVIGRLLETFGPMISGDLFSVSSEKFDAAQFLRYLIDRLGQEPIEKAQLVFNKLLSDVRLEEWRFYLRQAAYGAERPQARPLSPGQVEQVLSNQQPVDSRDLLALACDHLLDLADEIRHGNTNSYRNFWNLNSNGRTKGGSPLAETVCRDRICERLRLRLEPLGIIVDPEGAYSEQTSADIRVAYPGPPSINIPVEAKRDRHPELWSALEDQLNGQYVPDPGTGGYGVYLVFWFGGDKMPLPPDGSPRPESAGELEEALSKLVEPSKREKLRVIVVDVDGA